MTIFRLFRIVLFLCFASKGAAATISNYSFSTNDRFGDSFFASAYDWSGVGRVTETASGATSGGSTGRWATLIGDNYFLTANHFIPQNGDRVSFIDSTPAKNTYTYKKAGGIQIAGDLYLGWFDEAVSSSIKRYDVANSAPIASVSFTNDGGSTHPINNNGSIANTSDDYNDSNVESLLSGIGLGPAVGLLAAVKPGSTLDGELFSFSVGENHAESFVHAGEYRFETTNLVLASMTDPDNDPLTDAIPAPLPFNSDFLVHLRHLDGDAAPHDNVLTYEYEVNSGDSGSPLFARTSPTEMTFIGTGSLQSDSIPGDYNNDGFVGVDENRSASFYQYIGSYDSLLQQAISNNVPAAIAVPEPNSFILLSCVIIGCLLRRNRNSN
jgi:hypothetical protein